MILSVITSNSAWLGHALSHGHTFKMTTFWGEFGELGDCTDGLRKCKVLIANDEVAFPLCPKNIILITTHSISCHSKCEVSDRHEGGRHYKLQI